MHRVARVVVTWDCNRKCKGCCNTYQRITCHTQPLFKIEDLESFDEICITGGEPLIDIERTVNIIRTIKWVYPDKKVYLYCSWFNSYYPSVMTFVLAITDGIQYSLHHPLTDADRCNLKIIQDMMAGKGYKNKSFRLNIDSRINVPIILTPNVWTRVKVMPWLTEDELLAQCGNNGIPEGEQLFYYPKSRYADTDRVNPSCSR